MNRDEMSDMRNVFVPQFFDVVVVCLVFYFHQCYVQPNQDLKIYFVTLKLLFLKYIVFILYIYAYILLWISSIWIYFGVTFLCAIWNYVILGHNVLFVF